jgi:hypothetical protein
MSNSSNVALAPPACSAAPHSTCEAAGGRVDAATAWAAAHHAWREKHAAIADAADTLGDATIAMHLRALLDGGANDFGPADQVRHDPSGVADVVIETEVDLRGGHWTRLEGLGWMRTSALTLIERPVPARPVAPLVDGVEAVNIAMPQPRLDNLTALLASIDQVVSDHVSTADAVNLTFNATEELRTLLAEIRTNRSTCDGRLPGHNGTYWFPCVRRADHKGSCNRAYRYGSCANPSCYDGALVDDGYCARHASAADHD